MVDLILQDLLSQIKIRTAQLSCKPPFQTGYQSLLHPLQIDRRLIRSKDQLFSQLMKMIEYMEECILSLIHTDQFIDILVKIQKVIRCILTDCISKLNTEQVRGNI